MRHPVVVSKLRSLRSDERSEFVVPNGRRAESIGINSDVHRPELGCSDSSNSSTETVSGDDQGVGWVCYKCGGDGFEDDCPSLLPSYGEAGVNPA